MDRGVQWKRQYEESAAARCEDQEILDGAESIERLKRVDGDNPDSKKGMMDVKSEGGMKMGGDGESRLSSLASLASGDYNRVQKVEGEAGGGYPLSSVAAGNKRVALLHARDLLFRATYCADKILAICLHGQRDQFHRLGDLRAEGLFMLGVSSDICGRLRDVGAGDECASLIGDIMSLRHRLTSVVAPSESDRVQCIRMRARVAAELMLTVSDCRLAEIPVDLMVYARVILSVDSAFNRLNAEEEYMERALMTMVSCTMSIEQFVKSIGINLIPL